MLRVITPVVALSVAALLTVGAAAAEDVEIPAGNVTLKAVLFRPEGAGPFPAVVGLHGCGGLINRTGQLGARYRDWGERLVAAGFVVLYPDSFGPRGLASQCTVRERRARAPPGRGAPAQTARGRPPGQGWGERARGGRGGGCARGSSGRAAAAPRPPRAAVRDGAPDFRSAVAFYPGCRRLNDLAWSARVPTLILIGAADDWTPAAACQQMVKEARGRSAHAEIITYPGAHHEFDHPNRPITQRTGLAFSADGSGRAHVATHAAARADALRRVPEWLSR